MGERHARNLIRVLSGTALCTALLACVAVPAPKDLPAIALQQAALYRLEVALLVFYGALLLITPAFSGVGRGRLPTEISTRGAKFAEEDDRSTQLNEAAIEELEHTIGSLTEGLKIANFEIKRLKEANGRDSSQPIVGSKR